MNKIANAREKYRPEKVKVLFLAEAPPCSEDRFFYFENVTKGDSLFLHIIREVFPDLQSWEVKPIRKNKEEFLHRFMEEGYFLEDSVPVPIPKGTSTSRKMKIIRDNQANLINRIKQYNNTSKIVLLSSTVFKANYTILKQGFNVVNNFAIPFPGSGQQRNFKAAFKKLELFN